MSVRRAMVDDLPGCSALALAYSGGEADRWSARFAEELGDPDCLAVVAVLDGAVVGFGRTARFVPSADAKPDVAPAGYYLVGVVVAPALRRRGSAAL